MTTNRRKSNEGQIRSSVFLGFHDIRDFIGNIEPQSTNLCFCFCQRSIPIINFTDQWPEGDETMNKKHFVMDLQGNDEYRRKSR
jgi:hypothetical protein